MIIWLNGPFGAGKTTSANELASLMPGARICDPEIVGYLLMEYLKDRDLHDFQDVQPWRRLVPVVLSEIAGPGPHHAADRPDRGLLERADRG